mgnify:CR=1 FL=1
MAITKARKRELVDAYQAWLEKSRAVILAEYLGLTMKDLDALRSKVREAGGEFHVIKNTLGRLAFKEAGYEAPEKYFTGSTAAGFAFEDAPAVAKVIMDFARTAGALKVKGGYMDTRPVSAEQVKALAELPPLPVMRAQLLGTLLAPASQLARLLAEPGRQVAAVLKAFSEKEAPTATG